MRRPVFMGVAASLVKSAGRHPSKPEAFFKRIVTERIPGSLKNLRGAKQVHSFEIASAIARFLFYLLPVQMREPIGCEL